MSDASDASATTPRTAAVVWATWFFLLVEGFAKDEDLDESMFPCTSFGLIDLDILKLDGSKMSLGSATASKPARALQTRGEEGAYRSNSISAVLHNNHDLFEEAFVM